jgi:hypothetical protein
MKLTIFAMLIFSTAVAAQQKSRASEDSLQQQILSLRGEVENIKLNLGLSEKKFKRGIAVATIGYSVTITGGLMLGRKNDKLGKILLVAGGVSGITGTILMVDAFKYLGRVNRKKVVPNK